MCRHTQTHEYEYEINPGDAKDPKTYYLGSCMLGRECLEIDNFLFWTSDSLKLTFSDTIIFLRGDPQTLKNNMFLTRQIFFQEHIIV